jgi:hypothetical protein
MRPVSARAPLARAIAAAWLALTGPALVSASGCGDEGSGQASEAELAQCELPRGGYPDACNECLATECCAPIEACKANADCRAQLECVLGCQYASSPPECARQCFAAGRHPDYVAVDDCSFAACRPQCWL